MSKKIVYLDNAATTPVDKAVFDKMKPYFCQKYGNASASYELGEEARQAIGKARKQLAEFLDCESSQIIFTSGATESNNMVIQGLVKKYSLQNPGKRPHIIFSAIEHASVFNVCQSLKKDGLAETTLIKVNEDGILDVGSIKKAVKDNTILVSIMYANNEIGVIQPVREISKTIKEINQKRQSPVFIHTDAVQAANYLDCRAQWLGVDFLTLNAHKIYGPKGVGALYGKDFSHLEPILYGGGHEINLRSGTENTALIVGFGEAVSRIKKSKTKINQIQGLRDRLIKVILKNIPETQANGSEKNLLPNIAHLTFKRAEGESIIFDLAEKGIMASTGSACANRTLKPSQVLSAIGLSPIASHCSVRFSLGKYTTKQDIDFVLRVLPKTIKRLREISGK